MARSNPPMTTAFVSELARRLQGQGPALALPLTWIEQRLSESHLDDRAAGAVRDPAAGGQPGVDQQQHRQPALPGRDGLARVRRDDERRRAEAARGSRAACTATWISPRATATGTWSSSSRRTARCPEVEVARKAIQLAHEGAARDATPIARARARRLLPDRRRQAAARARGRRARVAPSRRCARLRRAFPLLAVPRARSWR